jgi:hypothetical protein
MGRCDSFNMLLTWKHAFVFIWVDWHNMITKLSLGAKNWYSKNIHFNCRSVYTHIFVINPRLKPKFVGVIGA